jgi:hypothetical protein
VLLRGPHRFQPLLQVTCPVTCEPELSLPVLRSWLRIGILLAYEKASEVPLMPHAEVMLLRFGSSFKLVCPDCRKVLAKNLPSEQAAYAHASAVVQHVTQCDVVRDSWLPHLLRILATS